MANQVGLGQRLRELRETADKSLRELAKEVGISAPFLSDVELGRRFPADENLTALAKALKVPLEELRRLDHRNAAQEAKKMIEASPSLGFAFRSVMDRVKDGDLSAEDVAARLKHLYEPKKK